MSAGPAVSRQYRRQYRRGGACGPATATRQSSLECSARMFKDINYP